jgi:hypothetical protein
MVKVPCTCGCGLNVSPTTKLNHIKGRGTIALRARVLGENETLKTISGQRQETQNRGSKRPFNPGQSNSRKRFKANPGPATFEADTGPTDFESTFPEDVPSVATQSTTAVNRTRHAMEKRWGAGRDNSHTDAIDEDDDNNNNNNDDDSDDDDDDNDDTMDKDIEDENEIPGLSAWDLLGEGFEREAAALGLSYFSESFT